MLKHPVSMKINGPQSLRLRLAGLCLLAALAAGPLYAQPAAQPPAPALQAVAQPRLAGQGEMRFLGLRIYDARLWVGPQFQAQAFAASPLVLELTYHRAFSAQSIAERSVQEIKRQRPLNTEQAARWTAQLAQWLPAVQSGDRLTGVYLPGQGMRLWLGEQPLGQLNDAELARYFFGIWLSPQTSEPGLRNALLAGLQESPP